MNNKETSPEQTVAKEKAEAIIQSCVTCEHFATVIPFLELFLKNFNDQESYNELVIKLKIRKTELNCHE